MNNFEFYNPTRIVFGEGKIGELDRLVPETAKVLVLYGGESARKNGTLDEVTSALKIVKLVILAVLKPIHAMKR